MARNGGRVCVCNTYTYVRAPDIVCVHMYVCATARVCACGTWVCVVGGH